jgi:hypothetical protein
MKKKTNENRTKREKKRKYKMQNKNNKKTEQNEKANNLKHPKCINCKRFARHHLRIKQNLNLRENISNFEILKKPENDTISSCDDCLDLVVQILKENVIEKIK